ncbi:MAG: translation initiation factor IF-2 [Desulfovibrionaceae bacterium]|nr:translation initiation factor IF-2 [Desulfovibrionaceae bacterium]
MKLAESIKKYKWILVGVILLVFIILSSIFGVRYYKFRMSTEFAFNNLQASLQTINIPYLAKAVDFRRIGGALAAETAQKFPFFFAGPHQVQRISNYFQGILLGKLKVKDEGHGEKKEEETEDDLLMKAITVLPPDCMQQLAANLRLQSKDDTNALLTTSYDHPLLKTKFSLILRMQKNEDGWVVSDLVNAKELVTAYHDLIIERINAQRALAIRKSEKIVQDMHNTMKIQSCTAHAGLISDRRTLMVVVHLLAHNTTKFTVKNVNAATTLTNQNGERLLFRMLNAASQTPPDSDFSYRWTIELDGWSEEGRRLASAGPLQCQVTWRTLTMSNARVFHTETPPKELELCTEHTDRHPRALCTMDIFSQK